MNGRTSAGRRGGAPATGTSVVRQLVLVLIGFVTYMGVRALVGADRRRALAHGYDILQLERSLGLDWERGAQVVTLQHGVLLTIFNAIYTWVYWPTLIGALVFLWHRNRARYVIFRNALFLSGAAGLVVFTTFPVAPPRMLEGFRDTVSEASRHYFIARPSGLINPYAALPSFHAGWFILAALMIAGTVTGVARRLVLACLPAMPIAVVVTANHYVVDVVCGAALSLAAFAVASWMGERRTAVRGATPPEGASPDRPPPVGHRGATRTGLDAAQLAQRRDRTPSAPASGDRLPG